MHAPLPSGIAITGLKKSFGSLNVLNGVQLQAHPGRITGLLGPNGAGKSTTLKCLLGLNHPEAGTALIDGFPYGQHAQPSAVIGAALDSLTVDPAMSGRDHLRVYAALGGHPSSRVRECIRLLDMQAYARRRTRGWSTGMRQRLSLATALLGDPRMVVLDEPTNGLDPDGITWVRTTLREMANQGKTILVSSHILAEFEYVLDDVAIIRHGRTIAQGPLAELKQRAGVDTLEQLYRATATEISE